jgi:pimeloyl-ACP methyl ester carboxylesterase
MAQALNEYFEEDKINLIGFSLGGYLSAFFALQFPHRIHKLMVISATPCNLNDEEINKRKQTLNLIEEHGFKGLARKKVVSLLDQTNLNNEPLIALIQQMYEDLGKEVFKIQLGSTLKRNDLSQALLDANISMSFVFANKDRLVNQEWMQTFASKTTTIEFNTIDSTSHMLPLEKPKEIATLLLS